MNYISKYFKYISLKTTFISLIALTFTLSAQSQDFIKGQIIDDKNKEPVAFAKIKIKNKQIMVKVESEIDSTTLYEVYKDTQGNKFYYEDGELKHTEIYGREESYDLSGEVI